MYIGRHVKYPLFLTNFGGNRIFLTDVRKVLTYKILLKSAQWESSSSMRTDGNDEAYSRPSKFCKRA
jgi:hypothetical protein